MPTAIREARKEDRDTLSALNAEIQAVHAAALPWMFKPAAPDTFLRAGVGELLDEPDNLFFIAEVDDVAVGYAYAQIIHRTETPFQYASDMVYLHHIGVRQEARRAGIGSALIGAVRAAASARDIGTVALDVWAFNDAARVFFRRHGFALGSERLWTR
jgi:ribosomal protein S18 acetylase RimI-like enzyme